LEDVPLVFWSRKEEKEQYQNARVPHNQLRHLLQLPLELDQDQGKLLFQSQDQDQDRDRDLCHQQVDQDQELPQQEEKECSVPVNVTAQMGQENVTVIATARCQAKL